MWHLFDRYTGVVWPKARQLNLIARILNNICAGVGMKLTLPSSPSASSPVVIAIDTEWLKDHVGGGGSGGEDGDGGDGDHDLEPNGWSDIPLGSNGGEGGYCNGWSGAPQGGDCPPLPNDQDDCNLVNGW